MSEFLRRHPDEHDPLLSTVREAMRSGVCSVAEPRDILLGREFLGLYEIRAQHLRRFETPHAMQLRRGVEAMLAAGRARPDRAVLWWEFDLPRGRSHCFIECASSYELLAAFTAVSKLVVSDEEWADLWGHGVAAS